MSRVRKWEFEVSEASFSVRSLRRISISARGGAEVDGTFSLSVQGSRRVLCPKHNKRTCKILRDASCMLSIAEHRREQQLMLAWLSW